MSVPKTKFPELAPSDETAKLLPPVVRFNPMTSSEASNHRCEAMPPSP
jgi:hypothetical protein